MLSLLYFLDVFFLLFPINHFLSLFLSLSRSLYHSLHSRRTLLAAACEYKSIVLFDPLAEKQVSAVSNAHDGSVNCIK